MRLRVLGCHGGETVKHRSTSFVIDGRLGVDAGATTSMLTLAEQVELDAVLVSHAHLDHVRDLASLADNRCQAARRPLIVAGTAFTIKALKEHFFNNILWPDFTSIPLVGAEGPTVELRVLDVEQPSDLLGYTVVPAMVSHTIESAGYVVRRGGASLAFSGDTGPTERFWEVLREVDDLRAILQEVSFPDELEWLARVSGHHTPSTLRAEFEKFPRRDIPWLLYHIKPNFQSRVESEIARLRADHFELLRLDDQFEL
ncbi:MAG: 3',5'-cyclic-nucleotide phosphodiesterase [Polyangiales bacterium]